MRHSHLAALTAVTLLAIARPARAQEGVSSLIPAEAPNCRVWAPPAAAGLAVTPGGFVMVYPRNDAITDRYTGCKILWIVDTDRTPRLATLVFEGGALVRAIAYDTRDPKGAIEGACAFPEGRSLLPKVGRRYGDSACRGFSGESFYALKLPTYPRICMTKPDAPECQGDPR